MSNFTVEKTVERSVAESHPGSDTVPMRPMQFEEWFKDVPRYFAADGDIVMSHVLAVLSAVFPDGEDFFVRSVSAAKDGITDPVLLADVDGFIGQESMHGREHRAFNDRLDALGYPSKRVERFVKKGLAIRERLLSPMANLAATAALEHFTATLAELVLTSEETRELFGAEPVRDLFVWHALEESEHKAVAFDVYRAVGGSERTRVVTMKILRWAFVIGVSVQIALALLGDGETYRPGRLRRSFARVRRSPFLSRDLWVRLCDYDRPDFHPDDHDTTELVETWRERLFGTEGTLNDRLAGAAA